MKTNNTVDKNMHKTYHKKKFSMYINNIRGVSSKLNSLESIVKNLNPVPSMICLSELNLKKNKKLKIKGYKCYNKNRQDRNMGGVATCVAEADEGETLKISEGDNENEYIVTRHTQFKTPLNVINLYGDVESRVAVDKIDERWDEIVKEVIKIEQRE